MPKNSLGDLYWKDSDPIETYFDSVRQGVKLPRRPWVVMPEWKPCAVEGMERVQEFFECHAIPRLWQLMADFWVKMQCATLFVKNPNWIEPPITAIIVDRRTEEEVALLYGVETEVLSFTSSDLFVCSLLGFGHDLVDPSQWGEIIWTIRVNGAPVVGYDRFRIQIGEFINPTRFTNPIKLKHGDVVSVVAVNDSADQEDALVFARLTGFCFPAKTISQDGTYTQYHTI